MYTQYSARVILLSLFLDGSNQSGPSQSHRCYRDTAQYTATCLERKPVTSYASRQLQLFGANLRLGKSVICSKIIEHIQDNTDMLVIYYFCSHRQLSSGLSNEILRNLATQLLAAKKELAPYILETFANNGLRPTKKSLGIILEKLITSVDKAVRIVVDGLDECSRDDYEEVIEDLLSIRGPSAGACKTLIASQKLASISKLLLLKPTVRLDDYAENVNFTISSYVNSQLHNLHDDFSSELIEDLGHQIMTKAHGQSVSKSLQSSTDLIHARDVPLGQIGNVRFRVSLF